MDDTLNKNGADSNMKREMRQLSDMMMGYQKTQIIYSVVKLGILEEMARYTQQMTAAQLANKLQLDTEATERLLNSCVTIGLLTINKTTKPVTYSCETVMSRLLVKSNGMSLRPLVMQIGDMYTLWGNLSDVVQKGQKSRNLILGDYFGNKEGFYINETKQLEFLQTMHLFSKQDSPHILKSIDLSQFTTACDLGGATGAFAQDLANKYPSMQVSVLELPHVVHVAQHFLDKSTPCPVQFIEGDFFSDPLPSADLFILSHVIHDWDIIKIELLLKKVYSSLNKGGGLLVLEKLLNDCKTVPSKAVMLDLSMLVGCEGKERTADEYKTLLQSAGFTDIQTITVPTAMHRDIILAKKC